MPIQNKERFSKKQQVDAFLSYPVTCIIAAYNEEKTIRKVVIGTKKYCEEVIVILAKNSKDRTADIAREAGAIIYNDNGKGKGAALRFGIEKATKDTIVFIDADGSHDPEDIPKLLTPIFSGDAEFVVGSRALGGSEELHATFTEFLRNAGGAIIMLYINYLYNVRYTDCENGFRAIKTDIIKRLNLNANDFDIEQEMVIKALKKKVKIKEVPTHEYKREFGASHLSLFSCGWKFVFRLLRELF